MKTAVILAGVTSPDLLGEIPEGGAAGFLMGVPGNPRSIDPGAVPALIGRMPNGVEAWAIVRDPTTEFVRRLYEEVGVDRILL
ncbi:MAG: hypothetical protein ACREC5_07820, partial [Thermoplasmata archaeon]